MTGESGFTLVEALVAMAVLGLALAAGLETLSRGTATVDDAAGRVAASALAQSLLDGLGRERTLAPGIVTGTGGDDFAWRLDISPVAIGTPATTLYSVKVEVQWGTALRPRRLSLDTLRVGGGS